jgi:hypothetical protein
VVDVGGASGAGGEGHAPRRAGPVTGRLAASSASSRPRACDSSRLQSE